MPSTALNGIIYVTLTATLSYKPDSCPSCHDTYYNYSIFKYGYQTVKVTFACSTANPKLILLKKQHFLCKQCNKTIMAQISLVDPHCQLYDLQKQQIKEQLRLVQSFALIARITIVVST